MAGHVVVCGLGQVGYQVVGLLLQLGQPVTVITQASRSDWLRATQERGVPVIVGDVRDESLLVEAGIDNAAALIAATDRDAVNLEIALDTRRRCPNLPIVIRLFDPHLARQVEDAFGVRRAIGISVLAAPSFAAQASDARVSSWFEVEGVSLAVGHIPIDQESPFVGLRVADLASRWNLAGITHEHVEGTDLPPDLQKQLRPTDRVTLLGAPSTLKEVLQNAGLGPSLSSTWRRRVAGIAANIQPLAPIRLAWDIWQNSPVHMRAAPALLGALIFFSLFIFQRGMNLSFVDALYFITSTVTTTGFGDITPRDASDGLKVYTSLFMILGSATMAILFSMVTDFVVTSRFQQLAGRRPLSLRDHIVIVGLGNVGYRTMDQLVGAREQVVGIERFATGEFVDVCRNFGPVIIGDARLEDTLQRASIRSARAVLAVTQDDATNLAVGLTAKRMNPDIRTVVQLFDADFALKAQTALDVDATLSASQIAAPTFVASALFPGVVHAFCLEGWLCALVHEAVEANASGLTPAEERQRTGLLPLLTRGPGESDFKALLAQDRLLLGHEIVGLRWHALSRGALPSTSG